MTKNTESALAAFSFLADAIGVVVADVKEDAKDAIENESGNAVELAYRQKALTDMAGRVQSLRDEFRSVMSGNLPVMPPSSSPPPISRRQTKLVVMFADGERIDYRNAAETFAASLHKIGLGRVLSLNEKLSGAPLVSKERIGDIGQKWMSGYWVTTQSSTPDKKKMLDKVAKDLGEQIVIEVVDK